MIPASPARPNAAAQLAHALRQASRTTVRGARARGNLPVLSETQVEAVRALVDAGGLSPTQVSAAVNLSRSTVSELARKLENDGLITRSASPTDGRSVVLTATNVARDLLATFAEGQADLVAAALGQLSPRDAHRLVGIVPELGRLVDRLQVLTEQAEAELRTVNEQATL